MIITHLLAYIVRDASSEALQKMLEMTSSQLKTERCTLQDILANVFNRLLGISFSESLDTLYERLYLPTPRRFSDVVFDGGKRISRQSK